MLIGALLVLTWLILLIRYPARALPVSLAALVGLALLAGWVVFQQEREQQHLALLELDLRYDSQNCPASRPLALRLKNGSSVALHELSWKVTAYAPGVSANLVENRYADSHYRGPDVLLPDATWQSCLQVPALRPGYRASTLAFRAEDLRGHFAD